MVDLDAIKKLVEKYERLTSEGKLKSYNEETTKKDFIIPLFKALGWDTESSDVSAEETIKNKRVDYGFRINGMPKFFLEAKSLREDDIINIKYVEQAIDYAWMKSCTWAVLTNFRTLIVYNAEQKNPDPRMNWFLKFTDPKDYIEKSDKVLLLSRDSIARGDLDKAAEEVGKKESKKPIDKALLDDITTFREALYNNIKKNNQTKNLSEEEVEEAVQRIIDRLIFIRNAEDRGLEPEELRSKLREWSSSEKKSLLSLLAKIYSTYNADYDSKLFEPHLCDEVKIDDGILEEVITGLYESKDKLYRYDFSLISADILGNIYEQYLGRILKKVGKTDKLEASKAKRKSEGIYYTPTYIVDYIVRNTVGELIKDKKIDVSKIKVLDPACGSGSFLIKTFDVLNEYHSSKKNYNQNKLDISGTGTTYSTKLGILKDNIFGVDLDKQAVDIAQLNLLLKVAEKKERLPVLQQNIKNGNSLIDDPNLAGDKAFKWNEEFTEIMNNGGFDVVVGNPPYVRNTELSSKDKNFYSEFYRSTEKQYDLYILFIEKAISLLKSDGFFGYIIPNKVLSADYGRKLREIILENCEILKITDVSNLPVFKDAATYPIILILKKKKANNSSEVSVKICKDEKELSGNQNYKILQNKFKQAENYQFLIHADENTSGIFKKIETKSTVLGEMFEVRKGIETGNDKERTFISESKPSIKDAMPVLGANTIRRYFIDWNNRYVVYNPAKLNGARKAEYFERPKLVTGRTVKRLSFAFDDKNFYTLDSTQILFTDAKIDLYGVLGLINSKLINFYYTIKFKDSHMQGGYIRCYTNYLEKIPIIKDMSLLYDIGVLAKKIIQKQNKLLTSKGKKTDESLLIEKEIIDADDKIDQLVYRIYGITKEEKKVIEESLK